MPTKPIFVDTITTVPAFWANAVGDLVYDVFGLAKTPAAARTALGLGSVALQAAGAVAITGGTIDGTLIGSVAPASGRFTAISVTTLTPTSPDQLTSKQYVDQKLSLNVNQLGLQDMAQQRSNGVSISGGVGTFDVLRVRQDPALPTDVVTLGYLQASAGRVQAMTPMSLAGDYKTVSLGFTATAGRVVLFVDGVYQLPDQYTVIGTTAVFGTALPVGSIVGGFQI